VDYDNEEARARAIERLRQPWPRLRDHLLHRAPKWDSPPIHLANAQDALRWVQSHPIGKYGLDYRLSEASLPWLVDLLSDENVDIVTRALTGLNLNHARIDHDETDDHPLTMYRVTLPDGSVYERPSRTEE
jgi:hypothetical protein